MKTSKRTQLLTQIIEKTNRAQRKVQEDFVMKAFSYRTPKLEKIILLPIKTGLVLRE